MVSDIRTLLVMADRDPGYTTDEIVYHTPLGIPLAATVYRPQGHGPFPAVVDAHGGRWCAETRLTNAEIDKALAASGIVVMAVDFRMPPVARYPKPVADINFAIRWLKAHAGDYHIDPSRVGGLGTSSGGHQMMLNALTPNDPDFRLDHDGALSAVDPTQAFLVACWPVSDPLGRYHYARERMMDVHVRSHHAYWTDEAEMAKGSPLRIVREAEAMHLPTMLIIQGADDVILSPGMSDAFVEAYRCAGGTIMLEKFEGEGHTFITKAPQSPASTRALDVIKRFIHATANRSAMSVPPGQ
jgi:acetyl esterase